MRFSNEQMASLAAQVFNFMTAASAPKAVAEKPKRRGNPEALAKARAVKAANAAAVKTPAKPAAESKPKVKAKVGCVYEQHVSKKDLASVLIGKTTSKYQRLAFHSEAEFRQWLECVVDNSDRIAAAIRKHCR